MAALKPEDRWNLRLPRKLALLDGGKQMQTVQHGTVSANPIQEVSSNYVM